VRFFNHPLAPRIVVGIAAVLFIVPTMVLLADEKAIFEAMARIVPGEDAIGRRYVRLLQARDFAAIETSLDPTLRNSGTRSSLTQAADVLPKGEAQDVDLVGYRASAGPSGTTVVLTYELTYAHSWALVAVGARSSGGAVVLDALQVQPLSDSLEHLNRFTFAGKGIPQIVWIFATLVIGLFVFATFVACAWEPYVKLRWLWMLIVCIGVVQFSMNWTTSESVVKPIAFLIPGIGMTSAGLYAPWIVSFTFPLGAVLYWAFRRKLTVRAVVVDPSVIPVEAGS
jgi:hypothetical protein